MLSHGAHCLSEIWHVVCPALWCFKPSLHEYHSSSRLALGEYAHRILQSQGLGNDLLVYISLLELPQQRTTEWVVYATDMHCLTVLEPGSLRSRCQQGWFLLSAVREGSAPSLCPWLVLLLPVSLHNVFSLCISVSKFPLFVRLPVILD